ncbi:ComEA family DNA-binding protein [Geomonas subterranea]|uniref:Helix-hairpin-helix domain-containing protein n=1 Tax=Geomonas subterranea TaxID=2847989 RepID=A0ABX8LLB0_9BACT|nr:MULTISPECIES: helix-hairpin-helix domain-containing protein [Geomonas]QXE91104.1 helix-hairpin-helix domain-containing protein [Geomonas subterranea]QXM10808.1 helix-hairpin-helix domain-containing protein [Geomonas subterranea]
MIPRSQRLAFWCLALLLTLSLYMKGRSPSVKGGGRTAFSRYTGQGITVRLAGKVPYPGVYRLPAGTVAGAAIKMTLAGGDGAASVRGPVTRPLASGDVVALAEDGAGNTLISLTKMGAKERMLLKIPLDPDLLQEEEWILLPGIGPALSRRIMADRQENGAFGSVEGLLRIPGIGEGKLAAIRRFF